MSVDDSEGFSLGKGDELLVGDREPKALTVTHHYDILRKRTSHFLYNSFSILLAFCISELQLISSSRCEYARSHPRISGWSDPNLFLNPARALLKSCDAV